MSARARKRPPSASTLEGFKFSSPYGPEIRRWLKHGIGLHHAGLLPKYRVLVEQLAQKGLLKIICGTDTLGVGINMPIRTVLFSRLCKFDGQKTAILTARDFHQIAGRAGRKGFDDRGWVVAQAPEHVVENLKLEEKAARDGKKIVKRKPPDKNFVNWDKQHLPAPDARAAGAADLALPGLARDAAQRAQPQGRRLPRHATADPGLPRNAQSQKGAHQTRLAVVPVARGPPDHRVHPQDRDRAPTSASMSSCRTISRWTRRSRCICWKPCRWWTRRRPEYPLVLLTLVESILEDPDLILRKQLDKLKTQKMAEMKMAGIEYDERMEELEKLEYPKPNREFVYSTFNAFADKHPWVGQENIRPKSIAREMFESFRSFSDYIRDYELQRAEGLLLRHLNSVYKVLQQTVPDAAKTDPVREMELYLGTMIRQVDSSLLDEWEKMRDPNYQRAETKEVRPPGAEAAAADITRDTKAFTAVIRNRIFTFLRALVNHDFDAALALLQPIPGAVSLSSSGGEGRGEEAGVVATDRTDYTHDTVSAEQNQPLENKPWASSPQPSPPKEEEGELSPVRRRIRWAWILQRLPSASPSPFGRGPG